jgi:hypothetical protein
MMRKMIIGRRTDFARHHRVVVNYVLKLSDHELHLDVMTKLRLELVGGVHQTINRVGSPQLFYVANLGLSSRQLFCPPFLLLKQMEMRC